MSASLAAVGAGFAASLGHVLWVTEAWVGITVTACAAIFAVLCVIAARGPQEPLRIVITGYDEVGDDTIAMVKGGTQPADTVGAEVEQWLRRQGGDRG